MLHLFFNVNIMECWIVKLQWKFTFENVFTSCDVCLYRISTKLEQILPSDLIYNSNTRLNLSWWTLTALNIIKVYSLMMSTWHPPSHVNAFVLDWCQLGLYFSQIQCLWWIIGCTYLVLYRLQLIALHLYVYGIIQVYLNANQIEHMIQIEHII